MKTEIEYFRGAGRFVCFLDGKDCYDIVKVDIEDEPMVMSDEEFEAVCTFLIEDGYCIDL